MLYLYNNSTLHVDAATNATDSMNNGLLNGTTSGLIKIAKTGIPLGENDFGPGDSTLTDSKSNLTLDFGYYKLTLGDQLWYDTNNNGVFDTTTEQTVGAGMTVDLLSSTGTVLATTTTDSSGKYLFDHTGTNTPLQPATTYQVKLIPPPAYGPSTSVTTGVNNANNGTLQADNSINSAQFTLVPGSLGSGQITTATTGTTSQPTIDFGILKIVVGDQLWYDTNNNGVFDTGTEFNVGSGVTVQLLDSTNTVIASTTTDTNGMYLFDHNTTTNAPLLPNTAYHINIPTPPTGFVASTVVTPFVNNNNNGTTQAGGNVTSATFQVTAGAATNGQTFDNPTATTSNLTLDFGFTSNSFSIGNRVWYDTNNNGVRDSTELGIPSVKVNLLDTTNTVLTFATTDTDGYYRFDNLVEGQYKVQIDASNFTTGGALFGYTNSTMHVDAATNSTDDQNNGLTNGTTSGLITLGPGIPTGESDLAPATAGWWTTRPT